jgi:hypothetical protein
MKIAWLGFGPGIPEHNVGLRQYDPDIFHYVIGRGGEFNVDNPDFLPKNGKTFTTKEVLLSDLEKFDVIIYDTYVFSVGDRPDIISYLPGNGCVTQWPEWMKLKARKILYDGESVSGKEWWYRSHLQYFDNIITTNPAMPGFLTYSGIDFKAYSNNGLNDSVKVSYSGMCINRSYRKELADFLRMDPKNVVLETFLDNAEWLDLLNKSKMYLATFSCANGEKFPMHTKNKEYKALLCGALPLTEELPIADKFLVPGKERATFRNLNELKDKINYYDTHEEERRAIVEAGKKKVIGELNVYRMWEKAFESFGLI